MMLLGALAAALALATTATCPAFAPSHATRAAPLLLPRGATAAAGRRTPCCPPRNQRTTPAAPPTLPPLERRCRDAAAAGSLRVARRGALLVGGALVRVGAGGLLGRAVRPAAAAAPGDTVQRVYVGAGCFWHVQHQMVLAERRLLGRDSRTYTAVAGYAGGSAVGAGGNVCYHNRAGVADYGRLGHAEVVAVQVPSDLVVAFSRCFIELFDSRGVRADPRDTGGEYRSAIGLPGGVQHPAVAVLRDDAAAKGMRLVPGTGDEGDTLADKTILVYDSNSFPFHAGELYHQFHDDIVGTYGQQYASLRAVAQERGALALSPCPGDSADDTALEALEKWAKKGYDEWKRRKSGLPSRPDF